VSYRIILYIISYHISYNVSILSYHIIRIYIISYLIVSYIVWYLIVSYHTIPYHIIYHIISYHIKYHIISNSMTLPHNMACHWPDLHENQNPITHGKISYIELCTSFLKKVENIGKILFSPSKYGFNPTGFREICLRLKVIMWKASIKCFTKTSEEV